MASGHGRARVFSWQETRLVSKSLTLSEKRVLYVLDPTEQIGDAAAPLERAVVAADVRRLPEFPRLY